MFETMTMPFKKGDIPWNKGKRMSVSHIKKLHEGRDRYIAEHGNPQKGKKLSRETIEKGRQSRLIYYRSHDVWNKGLKWPDEVKERIRKACIGKVGQWNVRK